MAMDPIPPQTRPRGQASLQEAMRVVPLLQAHERVSEDTGGLQHHVGVSALLTSMIYLLLSLWSEMQPWL